MAEVPSHNPSWDSREAFVRDVHGAARRAGLSHQGACLLVAHVALSTGWGRAAHNYRLAGIKANRSWRAAGHPYTVARGYECKDGGEPCSECPAGTGKVYSKMYWRAYGSVDAGVEGMLSLLKRPRYAASLNYLLAGSPDYFAQLGEDGWYTADPAVVSASCKSNLKTIYKWVGHPAKHAALTVVLVVGLAALGALV